MRKFFAKLSFLGTLIPILHQIEGAFRGIGLGNAKLATLLGLVELAFDTAEMGKDGFTLEEVKELATRAAKFFVDLFNGLGIFTKSPGPALPPL